MAVVEIHDIITGCGDHVVQFYEHDAELVAAVVPYLAAAVQADDYVVTASFPAEREAPGRARRLAVAELRRLGHDEAFLDEAALIVSELASNAVIHACSPFSITLDLHESMLRIAVQDECSPPSSEPHGGMIVCSDHGLAVIEALADRWGVEGMSDGKVVWAELRAR